jgi:hypothetical protein
MGEKSCSESSPCKDKQCEVMHCHTTSLPLNFVTHSTMKLLEFLKVLFSIDGFLSWPNVTHKCPVALQKTVYMVRLRALF